MKNADSVFKPRKSRFYKLDLVAHYFLYAACVVLGLLLVFFCLNRIYLARQSLSWTGVPGKIIWADAVGTGGKTRNIARLRAGYQYAVNGTEYVGNDVGYGFSETFGEKRETAEMRVARYPAAAIVTVYYDPAAPQNSCLEPGGDLTGYFFPASGALFMFVFGVWGFWRLAGPEKKSQQKLRH